MFGPTADAIRYDEIDESAVNPPNSTIVGWGATFVSLNSSKIYLKIEHNDSNTLHI